MLPICILWSKDLLKCANRLSPRLKQRCFTMKSAGRKINKYIYIKKKTLRDLIPLSVWKWYLKGEIKYSPREKYGQIAHSLEQAGLLLRDAGREKETERLRGIREERERECKKRMTNRQLTSQNYKSNSVPIKILLCLERSHLFANVFQSSENKANTSPKTQTFDCKTAIYRAGAKNDTNFPPDILSRHSSRVSETDTSKRSLDHGRKARCIDSGHKILGHHWLADAGFLLCLSVIAEAPALFLGERLIDRKGRFVRASVALCLPVESV